MELCYEMAIAAVIVLHGRAEKSNFIDIQGEKKDGGGGGEKSLVKKMKLRREAKKNTTQKKREI